MPRQSGNRKGWTMGRLIDEQDAYDVLSDYYHHSTDTQHAALKETLEMVPTVDAVPVRHGRWFIGDDGALHCSECSKTPVNRVIVDEIPIFDMTPIAERMKYCPNCGAKMDEKGGDQNG